MLAPAKLPLDFRGGVRAGESANYIYATLSPPHYSRIVRSSAQAWEAVAKS
jgi:hypothetical protein